MFSRPTTASIFPTFLLPSVPFRRRKSSTDTTNTACSTSSDSSDCSARSVLHDDYLPGHASHLVCAKCAADVCLTSQIISKGFTGRHGRAFLVSPIPTVTSAFQERPGGRAAPTLLNTKTEAPSQRQLVTGIHTVCDVRCTFCSSLLGWKYEGADEESQRYKVGKYILETKLVCTTSDWEQKDLDAPPASLQSAEPVTQGLSSIEFDSQDEDECEDLFAGVWSPALALKRRQNKNFRKAIREMEVQSR